MMHQAFHRMPTVQEELAVVDRRVKNIDLPRDARNGALSFYLRMEICKNILDPVPSKALRSSSPSILRYVVESQLCQAIDGLGSCSDGPNLCVQNFKDSRPRRLVLPLVRYRQREQLRFLGTSFKVKN